MTFFVDGRIKQSSHKAAKEIDRQIAPNTAIAIAVEDALSDAFEQRIRRGEINESVALVVGYEFSAALDELRAIVIE